MLFHTQAYLVFFLVVFVLYWASPWKTVRVYVLLAASFTFYALWNEWLALLVTGTATLDYLLARAIAAGQTQRMKRALVGVSLVVNLGVLCTFKYFNFFLGSLEESLALVGVTTSMPYLQVIVPFGISFYTFEAISYTIDVYQGRVQAERNLANFLLFILFFPHLVAGPIVRGRDFLRQADRPKRWSWARANLGAQLIVLGLFKKLALADYMASVSDTIFAPQAHPDVLASKYVWYGVIAFAVRIYCDFSGYSDMALGSAHLLGYKLTVNFRMPYFSVNVAEFWRRWHISLSTWLRDYLFIPLGGSRGSRWATYRNLLITMGLGGLWHGANASYLVWGLLHGMLLVVHRAFREVVERWVVVRRWLDSMTGLVLRTALTFLSVSVCWVFFQPSLSRAMVVLEKMFFWSGGEKPVFLNSNRFWAMFSVVLIAHLLVASGGWHWLRRQVPAWLFGLVLAGSFVLAQILASDTEMAFIYFVF